MEFLKGGTAHKFASVWNVTPPTLCKYKALLQEFYVFFSSLLTYRLTGTVQIDGTYVGGSAVKRKYECNFFCFFCYGPFFSLYFLYVFFVRGKDKQKNIFLRNVSKPKSEKRCVMIIMEQSMLFFSSVYVCVRMCCEAREGVLGT